MKKLHKLVVRSYIGPFIATFFLSLFILLMQFLWKYIDDLVGKGLEWYIIAELLFYASATFVPLALPLAVLLSSIMTMGAMGEHYELVAFKSAGISLNKIMWPLVVISSVLVISAFYFSNNILPVANLKSLSLLYDVRHHRPAFNIIEGVYYKGIDNFVIKADEKEQDGQTLRGIKIYDHSEKKGNTNLTTAEWGTMAVTEDKRHLVLTLYNGINYIENAEDAHDNSRPFQRTHFDRQMRKFDLSAFDLTRTDQDLFRSNFRMLNIKQLIFYEDSLSGELESRKKQYITSYLMRFNYLARIDSASFATVSPDHIRTWDIDSCDHETGHMDAVIRKAQELARINKDNAYFSHEDFRQRSRSLARYQIEFHRKFTLSIACIVLFMIGAPLGAIIRKGGFGLPVVVSVLFFVVFHVVSIMGEKFVREGVLEAHQGMWIASVLLLPVGILLTIKATTDSALLDTESYLRRFEKLFKKKT
jgi:lipopolysaccharide export system permease protein